MESSRAPLAMSDNDFSLGMRLSNVSSPTLLPLVLGMHAVIFRAAVELGSRI